MTPQEYEVFLLRSKASRPHGEASESILRGGPEETPEGEEAKLHQQIINYCKQNRWLYIHSKMNERSTATPGCPDFLLYLPQGVHLMVECKTTKGKLSPEQVGFHGHARMLGHTVHLVRSFRAFLELTSLSAPLPSEPLSTDLQSRPCDPSGSSSPPS